MKLYTINSVLFNSDSYIDLINDERSNTKNYISYNEGELLSKPKFKSQNGYTLTNIEKTDIYDTTNGNLHVFSEKFYHKMHKILKDEIIFFESDLIIENEIITCYVGKVINIQDIINKDKSEFDYWDEEGDDPLIIKPVFKKNLKKTKYCVKHLSENPMIVFTESFKELTISYNLKVRFNPQIVSD